MTLADVERVVLHDHGRRAPATESANDADAEFLQPQRSNGRDLQREASLLGFRSISRVATR
jgi:hypothetical protein